MSESLEEHRLRLAEAEREADFLHRKKLEPGLPPDRRTVYHNLERSARAEIILRHKAIDYLSGQTASSNPSTRDSSTRPATSGSTTSTPTKT